MRESRNFRIDSSIYANVTGNDWLVERASCYVRVGPASRAGPVRLGSPDLRHFEDGRGTMHRQLVTVQQHIMEEQRQRFPHATGEFSWLLSGITLAAKIIAAHVRR